MSVIGSNILAGASGQGGYFLTNSLRFRSSASAYLSRTPASATNRTTWTWSAWVKRGVLGGVQNTLFASTTGATDATYFQMAFGTVNPDCLLINSYNITTLGMQTAAVFRDPSAWYHIVFALDTTQATASNRMKLYVNGVQQTSFLTYANYPTLNSTFAINSAAAHNIGASNATSPFDGYLAEVNFIDGQALTPSSFGETSTTTGVWIPKKFSGTYGTNGFYLPFTDNSALTTSSNVGLGKDFSGNGNYFATNNISITAGSTYDSMTDVPTLTSATAANYAVMNPVYKSSSQPTISNGNLTVAPNAGTYQNAFSSIGVTSGKWYCEILVTGTPNSANMIGVSNTTQLNYFTGTADILGTNTGVGYGYYIYNGNKYSASTSTAYGNSIASGDIVGIALDLDNGKIWFSKNGTWQASGDPAAGTNAAFTGIASDLWSIGTTVYSGGVTNFAFNFGQQPFTYTPPSGFVRLNTFNLPTPTIGATASTTANKYMNVVTYTGTGSSLSVTGVGFQPDWTWIKERNAAADNGLYDAVRGVQKQLESNTTTAETTETTGLTAFGSDGFTVGALAQLNTSADTYVAWNWKANGAGVTNTAGSITSTVSANTTSGFSIVTWAGNSTNAATIGHGLGVAPSILITKSRTNASSWVFGIGGMSGFGINDYLVLQSTAAKGTSSTFYQAYGSSTFTVGVSAADEMNKTGNNYVTYCFAQVAGYSAFGSYTGNGSADGPFVYLGFRPKYLLIKRTNDISNWNIYDSSRSTYNVNTTWLYANLSDAELSSGAAIDFLSNGFKSREAGGGATNASGSTYIYMAFAEVPTKFSLAR